MFDLQDLQLLHYTKVQWVCITKALVQTSLKETVVKTVRDAHPHTKFEGVPPGFDPPMSNTLLIRMDHYKRFTAIHAL